ncbi:MAG: MaoC family dehydratase N-terminal domain-containing protein [Oscillospiraceae bacterium]|nr:MaoC family dehydratase N-terminal domain-containing protein [Oscillospiraceae bacterium]
MYFEDIELNHVIDIEPTVIDEQEMLDFAKRYDNIPLHTDEEYCKGTRFGHIIAPGVMAFMAVWANYLKVDLCGEELVAGKSTGMEWHKPVYANDVLYSQAVVSSKTPGKRTGIVELTFTIKNQNGEHVMTNLTEMVVKRKEA